LSGTIGAGDDNDFLAWRSCSHAFNFCTNFVVADAAISVYRASSLSSRSGSVD
jgi:hypothetical protein